MAATPVEHHSSARKNEPAISETGGALVPLAECWSFSLHMSHCSFIELVVHLQNIVSNIFIDGMKLQQTTFQFCRRLGVTIDSDSDKETRHIVSSREKESEKKAKFSDW